MLQIEMSATARTQTGKGAMRRLRNEGLTPAIVYGAGSEAQALQMDTKSLNAQLLAITRKNAIVVLRIEGANRNVLVGEVQTDPVTDKLIHVDFCEIDVNKAHVFEVPLKFEGTAKGEDFGGYLNILSDTVQFEGKPLDVPDLCTLDVSDLDIGDGLAYSKIDVPENVTLIADPEAICVMVSKQGAEVLEEEEEGEEAAEGAEGADTAEAAEATEE